jgi:hypothetical protein
VIDSGGSSIGSILLIILWILVSVSWFATVIHAFRRNRPAWGTLMGLFPPLVILYWIPTLGEPPSSETRDARNPAAR